MNEDDFIGPWSINTEWQQVWNAIPQEYLVFYTSPEAELQVIDGIFDETSNLDVATEMLESIGIKCDKG